MTRGATLLLLFVAIVFRLSAAWVAPLQSQRHATIATPTRQTASLFLRSDQAKELEECAFELMKQALAEEEQAKKATESKMMHQKDGPWAWCLKHLPRKGWWSATNSSAETLKP